MRVALYTFGCKLNQYETEALAQSFLASGHEVGTVSDGGELYVVSTCTVTSRSEQKARRLIRALLAAAPGSAVVVTGCYAQTDAESIGRLGANIVCVPQERKHLLLGLGERLRASAVGRAGDLATEVRAALAAAAAGAAGSPFAYSVGDTSFHARATLKIQDGCDYGCAYCRVPLARGPSVSRSWEEVLAEARSLEASGHREVVLTGVNVAAWRGEGRELADLIQALLAATSRLRLRLSSLEPERIRGKLLEALRGERVCPHFHLPVQSGADSLLLAMGRRYLARDVERAVLALREVRDDPFIAADLIAGLPGETAGEHEATVALVRSLDFSQLHVFPYSPRPGTRAWGMKPRVPERIRDERTAELRELSALGHGRYVRRWLGRETEVLVEEAVRGEWRGTSGNYLKVRLPGIEARRGELVRVALDGPDPLVGRLPAAPAAG